MSTDIFLKLETIEGESSDKSHPKEIQIESFTWGVSRSRGRPAKVGPGDGFEGRPEVRDLDIVKEVDKSSATLYMVSLTGKVIPKGVITVRKAGAKPLPFLIVRMKNVIVLNMTTSAGAGGGDTPIERLTLGFDSIQFEYTPQKQDGSAAGGAVRAAWDVAAGRPHFME